MRSFTCRNKLTVMLLFALILYFNITQSNCTKEPVSLDVKLKVPHDDIDKIVKFRKGTSFKIKDPEHKRIGEVKYGSIMVMKDLPEEIDERTVYLKALKRSMERYIIKIITKREEITYTEEFLIEDGQTNKSCTKILRDAIDVDIRNIDDDTIRTNYSQTGWYEYSIRNEMGIQYRIGNINDGDVPVVRDGHDLNIRIRYFHVLKTDWVTALVGRCLPFLGNTKPTLVRVFTYYYIGERSFDEYIEKYYRGNRSYVELVRGSYNLDLGNMDTKRFKRSRMNSDTYIYSISDEFKNNKKIGRVMNNNILVASDSHDIRLRCVYTNVYDTDFENIEVKTCYKKGDCKRCKYILEDNKYNEVICKKDKDGGQDIGSSSKVFSSKEQLEDIVVKKGNTYLKDVILFEEKEDAPNQILVDVNEPKSKEFTIDLMPQSGALYYSLNSEYAGRDLYVRITESDRLIATIHLYKTKEVDFIVKNSESGKKRVFVWIKCGLELFKGNDFVIIDTLKQSAEYINKAIPIDTLDFLSSMIN